MRPASTPRPARLAERASLLLLAAGVTIYGAAYAGMQRLERGGSEPSASGQPFVGLAVHARYHRASQGGLAVVATGLLTAVGATVWTARARRSAAARPDA